MSITRREFVGTVAAGCLGTRFVHTIPLRLGTRRRRDPARLAVIADLHHGLAPDALSRFEAFLDAAAQRRFDAYLQMGDFTYSDAGSPPCLNLWHRVTTPRLNVLGNHDMDKVDKATAMQAFGMTRRYHATTIGGYRFVILDLNNFRKNGALYPYANGNYFTDNATWNCADPDQLAWLREELGSATDPVILISHQPLGFADAGNPLPVEQVEVLTVVEEMGRKNPDGRVAALLSGHLHVDRLEHAAGAPCVLINSSSYFWYQGMHPYTNPLFAFIEVTADGMLRIEGRSGAFRSPPPAASDGVLGRSASLSSRDLRLGGD
jgi:Calcineurin-like phosphoesterase